MRINCGKSLFSPLVLTSVESQGTNALEWEERDLESECVSVVSRNSGAESESTTNTD